MRPKITLNMKPIDIISTMSEGNPGAINAMMALIQGPVTNMMDLLHLDDMNIWGPQIWVGFKDFAGGDAEVFRKAIRDRDKEMVNVINKELPKHGPAVIGGASYERPTL